MSDDPREKVRELISYHSGIDKSELFDASRLEQDLGITGDDAWELLEDIQEKLAVDFSEFEFQLYFHGEVEGILSSIINRNREKHRKAYPITVSHLIRVAEAKKWFRPPQVRQI